MRNVALQSNRNNLYSNTNNLKQYTANTNSKSIYRISV